MGNDIKKDMKKLEKFDLPSGFTIALAENPQAVKAFANMPDEKRDDYIERAKNAFSKAEMQRIASDIAQTEFTDFI